MSSSYNVSIDGNNNSTNIVIIGDNSGVNIDSNINSYLPNVVVDSSNTLNNYNFNFLEFTNHLTTTDNSINSLIVSNDISYSNIDEKLSVIEPSINKIEIDISNINNSINDIKDDVDYTDTSVNNLQITVGAHDERLDNIDISIDIIENKIPEIDMSINTLENKIPEIDLSINTLENKIPKLDMSINTLEAKIPKIDISLSNLNARIDSNDVDIQNIYNTIENNKNDISANQNDIDDLDVRIAANESDISDHNTQIALIKNDISYNRAYVLQNQSDITSHTGQLSSINGLISTIQNDIHDINNDIGDNTIIISNNTTDISNNKISISEHSKKLDENETNIINIQQNLSTTDNSVNIIENKIPIIDASISLIENDIEDIDASINDIYSLIEQRIEQDIQEIDGSINTLETNVSNIDVSINVLQTTQATHTQKITDIEEHIDNSINLIKTNIQVIDGSVNLIKSNVENIDASISLIENVIEDIDVSINDIYSLIEQRIEQDIQEIDVSINTLETNVSNIDVSINVLQTTQITHTQKIADIEQHIDSSINLIKTNIQVIDASVNLIKSNIENIDSSLVRLNNKTTDHDTSLVDITNIINQNIDDISSNNLSIVSNTSRIAKNELDISNNNHNINNILTQDISFSGNKTFDNNVTINGILQGPSDFYIDPKPFGIDNEDGKMGNVIIRGNLLVDGSQTIINSNIVDISDKTIVLASNASELSQADGAGIQIMDASGPSITYNSATTNWVFNSDISANVIGRLIGNANTATRIQTINNNNILLRDSNPIGIGNVKGLPAPTHSHGGPFTQATIITTPNNLPKDNFAIKATIQTQQKNLFIVGWGSNKEYGEVSLVLREVGDNIALNIDFNNSSLEHQFTDINPADGQQHTVLVVYYNGQAQLFFDDLPLNNEYKTITGPNALDNTTSLLIGNHSTTSYNTEYDISGDTRIIDVYVYQDIPEIVTPQSINSIIFNASTDVLNSDVSGFYVNPIRKIDNIQYQLYYNKDKKEIVYSETLSDFYSKSYIDTSFSSVSETITNLDFYSQNYIDTSLDLKADIASVDTSLNLKADITSVDASLNLKADITSVDASLNLKADIATVDTSLNLKADIATVDTSLNLKADITTVDTSLNLKADISQVYSRSYIDSSLNLKANVSDIPTDFYSQSYIDSSLNLKANTSDIPTDFYNRSYIDSSLNLKANTSQVYSRSYIDNSLNLKANASDIPTDFYSRSYVDSSLNLKANTSDIPTDFYSQSYIDTSFNNVDTRLNALDTSVNNIVIPTDFYSRSYVDSSLNLKANTSDIPTDFYSQSYIDTSFNNVDTRLDALDTSVNNIVIPTDFYSQSYVDNSLNLKANTSDIPTDFYSQSYIDTSFNNVDTRLDALDTSVNNIVIPTDFYSQSYVDSSLNLKANTSDIPTDFYSQSYIDTSFNNVDTRLDALDTSVNNIVIPTDFYSQSYVDNSLNLKANTSDIPTDFYSQSYIDTSFNNIDTRLNALDTSVNNILTQDISFSGNKTFHNNVTINGILEGPSDFYIDPKPFGTNNEEGKKGNVIIRGNLLVDGSQTIINSNIVDISDKTIVLASNASELSQADGAGIQIMDASGPSITYNSATTNWDFNRDISANVVGSLIGNVVGSLIGNANTATRIQTINNNNILLRDSNPIGIGNVKGLPAPAYSQNGPFTQATTITTQNNLPKDNFAIKATFATQQKDLFIVGWGSSKEYGEVSLVLNEISNNTIALKIDFNNSSSEYQFTDLNVLNPADGQQHTVLVVLYNGIKIYLDDVLLKEEPSFIGPSQLDDTTSLLIGNPSTTSYGSDYDISGISDIRDVYVYENITQNVFPQSINSIIFNASTDVLNSDVSGFYVNPIRKVTDISYQLFYDVSRNEIVYSNTLADFYSKSYIDTSFTSISNIISGLNFYSREHIDASYATAFEITGASFAIHDASLSELSSNIDNIYLDISDISGRILAITENGGAYSSSQVDTSLALHDASLSDLYNKINNIDVYNFNIDATLTDYYTIAQADASFTAVNNNITEISNNLDNYYLKTEIDTSFTAVNNNITEISNNLDNYYLKTDIDASFNYYDLSITNILTENTSLTGIKTFEDDVIINGKLNFGNPSPTPTFNFPGPFTSSITNLSTSSPLPTNNFTIECTFATTQPQLFLVGWGTSNNHRSQVSLIISSNSYSNAYIKIDFYYSGLHKPLDNTGINVFDGQPHTAIAKYGDGVAKLYLDGQLLLAEGLEHNSSGPDGVGITQDLIIGQGVYAGYNGSNYTLVSPTVISDVKIYDTQIQEQSVNSIVLNDASGFYVNPIRNVSDISYLSDISYILFYDVSKNEIVYAEGGGVGFDATATQLAIGYNSGLTSQQNYAIAIGYYAGYTGQKAYSIGIGFNAGNSGQATKSVAIGTDAGNTTQETEAIAIGYNAGYINQKNNAIAIGSYAGRNNQGKNGIGIGVHAGESQGEKSIAIGINAGTNANNNCVAIGSSAGKTQNEGAIAIGWDTGTFNQGSNSIALGLKAGNNNQGVDSISIGNVAGTSNQATCSVAIGNRAGFSNQQEYSIAIGNRAGFEGQCANSIILNADQNQRNCDASGFYVNPIRNVPDMSYQLFYDATRKEIVYAEGSVPSNFSDITTNDISMSGILKGPSNFYIDPAPYDVSGEISNVTGKGGTVIIRGNLQVDGSYTIIDSNRLDISDTTIVLASKATDLSQADGAGIKITDISNENHPSITYNSDNWVFNRDISAQDISANSIESSSLSIKDVSNLNINADVIMKQTVYAKKFIFSKYINQ